MNYNEETSLKPENKENRQADDLPVFEIFGINLYSDDLLILGLLFFLYSEKIYDEELFIILVLLLIA